MSPSPLGRTLAFVEHDALPSIAEVARPVVKLAGVRIDPAIDAPWQGEFGTALWFRAIDVTAPAPATTSAASEFLRRHARRVDLPSGSRIVSSRWSPDERALAVVLAHERGSDLWLVDVASSRARRLVERVHCVLGPGFEWVPHTDQLVVARVPAGRGAPPERPTVAAGPIVVETRGERSPSRTFQDLLRSPHDERLLDHHASSELVLASTLDGSTRALGIEGLVARFEPSPDGRWLLVERVVRPYSYLHVLAHFPRVVEAHELATGRRVRIADVPLLANVPIEGVREGPRAWRWCAHGGARLAWVEALDGGDPKRVVAHRDRWMELDAPFDAAPRELTRLQHRASGLSWMPDANAFLVREYDRDRRWTRQEMRFRDRRPARVLDDRSVRERYADPGAILHDPHLRGRLVVRQRGPWIFRSGEGAFADGLAPFVDRQDVESGAVERLFESARDALESPLVLCEDEAKEVVGVLTRHETPVAPPNLRLRRFGKDAWTALTAFGDPQPALRGVEKRLVRYTRADGVELSGMLFVARDRDPAAKLPLLLWAYPNDYVDGGTASQNERSPQRFTRVLGASPVVLALAGFAVLDDPRIPIVGDPETMNDRFVEQAESSLRAAIEHVAALGIADPARCAIGGHSYGAFLTAMMLASSSLFRCGIARSGAFNRTLTPFGFQSERRTLWEASKAYVELSPLVRADAIRAPLLLIHGAEDENPGTHPMQSERLFHALKGLGGTARHVVLPHEGHGYRSKEAVLHVLAEMHDWLVAHLA